MPELAAGFFGLAGATRARSPPGRQPNGMAGWLPALALIAASLRFEVTRSFQSFISPPQPYFMPVTTPSRQQPRHPSLPALFFAGRSSFAFLRARTASAHGGASLRSILRCLEETVPASWRTSSPPWGSPPPRDIARGTRNTLPAAPRQKKKPQGQRAEGLCQGTAPHKIICSCRHSLPRALGGCFISSSL